jgi:hypothetical protein
MMHGDGELERLAAYLGIDVTDRRRPDLYRARGDGAGIDDGPVRLPRSVLTRVAAVQERLDRIRTT